MYKVIYDEVIRTILLMLDKLDLDTEPVVPSQETDAKIGDINTLDDPNAIRPRNPSDYQFFLNLVDFTGELLTATQLELFSNWVLPFGRKLIILSHTYPHVSGYYKLLTTCMTVCRRLKHFEENVELKLELTRTHSDTFILFKKFLSEQLLALSQLKGEMLAAALHLILSFPIELVERDFSSVIPAIRTAFELGLSHLPLANTALDTLEEWLTAMPPELITRHIPDILPALNEYLTSSADAGAEGVSNERALIVSLSGSKRFSKMSAKKLRTAENKSEARDLSSQLSKIRNRIVLFLGSLGGQTNSFLIRKGPNPNLISWDTSLHLKYHVPFQDIKPIVYLDPFLPRVIDLALHSSDRQSKVCACELLHAITIYTIGFSATQPDSVKKRSPQRRLYSHLFPAMLSLSCDVEEVSVQLFRPLTLQTIHWFTGNKTFESPDTMELLNAILTGLEDASSSALRDFSAVCVKEFLAWSIKQTTTKQQQNSSANAKSLLKRLYSMALHPIAFRRLGAALAFNKIYTVFREEDFLVNTFTIEILVTYLRSLKQSHRDALSLGIQTEIVKVVSHLERIIKAKQTQFNQVSKDRKIPKGWKVATIQGIVSYAISNVGATETAFRHACMDIFCELCPLVGDVKAPMEWLEKASEKGIGYFTTRFERGGADLRGILHHPILKGTHFSLRAVEIWFESLTASIDCYCWVLNKKLFTPTKLFSSKTEPNSMLFESIGFFCNSIAFSDIVSCTKCFDSTSTTLFTPRELDSFDNLKSQVVLSLLQLLTALLCSFPNELTAVPSSFWSEDLMTVVLVSVLNPSHLGFSSGNLSLSSSLQTATTKTCKSLRALPPNERSTLTRTMDKLLSSNEYSIGENLSPEGERGISTLTTLINGYIQLFNTGLYGDCSKEQSQLPESVIQIVMSLVNTSAVGDTSQLVSLSPQQITLAGMLVDFAAKLGTDKGEFLNRILSLNSESGRNGEVVYSLFSEHINQIVLSDCHTHLSTILNNTATDLVALCLNSLIDYAIREKVNRRVEAKISNNLVPSLLELWPHLNSWYCPAASQDSKICFLTIFNKFTKLLSANVFNEYPKSHCLLDTFSQLISDTVTLPTFRSQCLYLLPFLLTACIGKPELRLKLKTSLSEYIQNNFPLYSTELVRGSTSREEYITAIDRLLAALASNTNTILMLEVLLPVVCREERHIYGRTILRTYETFIESASPLIAKAALELYFQVFSDETSYSDTIRKCAAIGFVIPMLSYASEQCFREFYATHIVELMKIIEAKLCRHSDPHFESQLTSKQCAFGFIESLYSRLICSDLSSMDSKLNAIYCAGNPKNGKELTQAATKSAHAAKSEDHRGEPLSPRRLEYHQSAYNLLCSVITCTQTKMAFYSTFLFKEDLTKGSILWENLVNTSELFGFSVLLDTPMEQSHKLTTIRSNPKSGSGDSSPPLSPPPSVRYISSQYLSQPATLVTDLSQYDMSMSPSFFSFKRRMRHKHNPPPQGMYVVSEEKLELDAINRNPCMHSILRVLDYMQHNSINPDPPTSPSSPSDLPQWMLYLHTKLTDANTHSNVRLFIAKIIINRPLVFQLYARVLIEPLVQIILLQCSENKGMHYFIVDLTVTLLSWAQTYIFEDKFLATKVLHGLMANTHADERPVLRNNLSIVRTMVECWKDSLTMPYGVIHRHFCNKDTNGRMQRTGVQLLGIVLANGLPPYGGEIGVSEANYYEAFFSCLEHRLKEVYAPAAEVSGMLFKSIKNSERFDLELVTKWGEERMSGILSAQGQPSKFIECLYKIHINFPEFCDRFLNRILFLIPSLKEQPRDMVIEIIASRADSIADLKTELKTKNFYSILKVKDSKTQVSALKLALKIVPTMDETELAALLDILESILPHTSPESREVCYEFAMAIFDRKSDSSNFSVKERAKSFLLKGLLDSSEGNRLKVFAYWNNENRLPSDTVQRLIQILSLLYSEGTEDKFLSYSTNFFLELTSRSPDYQLEIFSQPLAECKFQTQKLLDYSYSYRQSGFLPLFANTLPSLMSSQSQGAGQESQPMETETAGELRSTIQPIAFTPTQDANSTQATNKYDWLTPTLQSQQLFNPGTMDADTAPESSLLFTGFKVPKRMKQIGSNTSATLTADDTSHPVMQLKRRFLKGHEASTVFHQKQGIRKKRLREEYLKFQKASRGNKVVMYRQYRTGDLPDIQIRNSELIRPLQALAQRDDKVARLLFSTLFTSIFADLNKYLSGHDVELTKQEVQRTVNGVLKATQRYSPPFIAAIMDISLKEDCSLHFYLEPTLVSTSCLVSCQQLAGIMVLENQLLQKAGGAGETARGAKRAKGAMQAPTEETAIWIELGRLYKSIEDFDTLRGIFGSQIGTREVTRRGIEEEETNDYLSARNTYKQALEHAVEGETSQEEQDLWEDSLMSCLENLGKWKELELNILSCMTEGGDTVCELSQVWQDDYYIERHLPRLMNTKVKLMIAGREDPSFDRFIENSFLEDIRRTILETHYSEQLALYFLAKNNIDRAKHYVQLSVENFALLWSGLPDLQPFSRASKLRTLQRLVEMSEFINFVSDRDNLLKTENLDRLLRRWHDRLPDKKMDPLSVWSDVITNRSFYLQALLERYEMSDKIDQVESQLTNEVLSSYLSIAEAASVQANFSVASHFTQQVTVSLDVSPDTLRIRTGHVWAGICLRKERAQVVPSSEDVSKLVSSLFQLQQLKSNHTTTFSEDLLLSSSHLVLEGHQTHRIAELLQQPEGGHLIASLLPDSLEHLKGYLGNTELAAGDDTNQLAKKLYLRSLTAFKLAVSDSTNYFRNNGERGSGCMVSSLLAMAK